MKRFVSHISNKELDRDLELNYFGARYYQPDFPRFLSPDPVGGTPEVPISWNRYLYCRNDPINYYDPDGRMQRDANGALRVTHLDKVSYVGPLFSSERYKIQHVILYTDDGTPIPAVTVSQANEYGKANNVGLIIDKLYKIATGKKTGRDNPADTNCVGVLVADGLYGIDIKHLDKIIKGDNYKLRKDGEPHQVGDMVVYFTKANGNEHVARVTVVDENGNATSAYTLGGYQTIHDAAELPIGPGSGTAFGYDASVGFYHRN